MKIIIAAIIITVCSMPAGCEVTVNSVGSSEVTGSLSVLNKSDIDIFPIITMQRQEDFGGVSSNSVAMIGFGSILLNKSVQIDWSEVKLGAEKKKTIITVDIEPELVIKIKHLEFVFGKDKKWMMNMYGFSPPSSNDLIRTLKPDKNEH